MFRRRDVMAAGFLVLLPFVQTAPGLRPDPPIACHDCDEWNGRREPFRIFGNSYYVGVAGLSAVLIASDKGLILLDGALPQSAPLIDGNIRKLGFRTEDVRLIVNSHAVSAPEFRFTGDASHPGIVDSFRQSIAKVARLPCDIIVSVHPGFTDLEGKLKRRAQQKSVDPFVDPQACRTYAAGAAQRLEARVADEKGKRRAARDIERV